jgi:hypothetical protein
MSPQKMERIMERLLAEMKAGHAEMMAEMSSLRKKK